MLWSRLVQKLFHGHKPRLGGLEVLEYIGPGFLVTVGFIDPGNWATNVAAGSQFGYLLLWMVTVSTALLVYLQHKAANLGIVTGLCLAEATAIHFPKWMGHGLLVTALGSSVSTCLAAVLGAAIGLNLLSGIPIPLAAILVVGVATFVLFSHRYRKLERYLIGLVSLVGLSFLFELSLVKISWGQALAACFVPSIPRGSISVILAVLGAVVMPHNLFLHSEIIQSRDWNRENIAIIKKQQRFELLDTLLAMGFGWVINCSMILVAASVFFSHGQVVTDLPQAGALLKPLLGNAAAEVFALALLVSGFSSTVTAAMSGASITAGMIQEPFDLSDNHSRVGALITMAVPIVLILLIKDTFKTLIWSQIALSLQLPFTMLPLVLLISSRKVMGSFVCSGKDKAALWVLTVAISLLNIFLVANSV